MIRLEWTYDASAEEIWKLWTTSEGIESWWAPDGFDVKVRSLELQPGGELVYELTAIAPEQVQFMQNAGLPLATLTRKVFTDVVKPSRLAYTTLADFIPGVEPYEFLTVIELAPDGDRVQVLETIEEMHDEEWTQRLVLGRENELDNLARTLRRS